MRKLYRIIGGVECFVLFIFLLVSEIDALKAAASGDHQIKAELKQTPGEYGKCEIVHDLRFLHLGLIKQTQQVNNVTRQAHVDEQQLGEGTPAYISFRQEPPAQNDQQQQGDLQAHGNIF